MKAAFNAVCQRCDTFKPRCATVGIAGMWVTLCEQCRHACRVKYILHPRHKGKSVNR